MESPCFFASSVATKVILEGLESSMDFGKFLFEQSTAMDEPPAQMTELDQIKYKMNAVTDESLDATRRMMAMCEEQLDRINEGMDQINEDMKDAEKNLDDLNKCCGLCVLPWNKRKGKSDFAKQLKDEDGFGGGDGPRIIVDQNGMGPTGGYITRITNDAREDEMDQNMQEVAGMIGNLRNMAIDMGSEITQQNTQVERIHLKAKANADRIKKANEQASKLLK
ncbi:Synaptosomal-associated protein 25 [Echinococcus granulosus]|uniref:Synaptosomal-associated protein n=1 Tax=Echinococcus granulosus TaxID=6210 RepID=W6URH7_ECHGR|nr:Synaptosomal-associated protein 25 [Echinococcus granulosus]EUB63296.1 Synaptosomal-associated protein 25 [Echinococcus granulosus]